MKKLISIIIVAGLALTIQAQDITNTLGSSTGVFKVEESEGAALFTVKEFNNSPEIFIGPDVTLPVGTIRQLNIIKEGGTAGLNLFSYKASGFGSFNKLGFYHSRGTVSSPETITTSDDLGRLTWIGYTGSSWKNGAAISVDIESVGTDALGAGIIFETNGGEVGSAGLLKTRMTIKSDGKVGIGTQTPNSTLNVEGSFSLPYKLVVSSYVVTETDYTIVATEEITITLPDPTTCEGRVYVIKEGGSGSVTITIQSANGEHIDGLATQTLEAQWQSMMVQSTGAIWITLSK